MRWRRTVCSFRRAGELNRARVPGWALMVQGLWAAVLVLAAHFRPRHRSIRQSVQQPAGLRDLRGAALLHSDHRRRFRLRHTRPNADRPYRVAGYPFVPGLYIIGASVVLLMLFAYRPATTWPGLVIVILGAAVYGVIRKK